MEPLPPTARSLTRCYCTMEVIRTVDGMQAHVDDARSQGRTLALVPTLGALHEGHLALVRTALEEANHVTVSVFVNPTQFGPDEDYEVYPRDLEGDKKKLKTMGVDTLFAPPVEEMYPFAEDESRQLSGPLAWVDVNRLDEHLCGAYREEHFRGVATVVTKLFHACKPDLAVFGKKDAQQYVIIQHLVDDLLLDLDIIGVPTVREADGLAQSSRNKYLDEDEREQATVLYEAVSAAQAAIEGGEQEAEAVVRAMHDKLSAASRAEIEYAAVVDAHTLQPVEHCVPGQEILAAVAVYFGDTRLIDNTFVQVSPTA